MSDLPSSFDNGNSIDENEKSPGYYKILERCKEQPLVPLGCLATCGALILSARALRVGNKRQANRMFFARVAFQGLTVAALIGGAMYYGQDPKQKLEQKEREKMLARHREKLWIEELERRDLEVQERRKRAAAFRQQEEEK
ncbi:altered inheritance of mitochondria protein 31, mitochondrial [Yarrowia lipolytica]|uniref:Respiratory supercomplex factor 1, mitochondrial n=2 Tax=Yarrowia lipolytica TaxID=4952 RepID=RCF1_YARLI|nr:YALI0C16456p [Yarrowia lipolytica CLIB122]Q6CBQ8.2 RecName: Full=Respiratory supercomplex factor 1, mitochondrial [Yarrowia lipolytica CLIB122]AOW02969.1 hypothetical protein YALI1_C23526g [Yarrowia lipolytica]KAB8283697.1 altered inheritance of mitochondria protein 31, mitochondrial [Yarrowia lipolytica]KAE8172208.1 altered inheritance of mitochondria protein 31, mitochondrial [Yarrowia lipolytica]KAJ8053523.1 altered inheritance of mitochondria protein 31, mitochondrial [Yarrowia lipolyti|eukprot:XP_501904.2 YALI0C16456p [Yarrowia lipolytica CLIB122]